MGERVGQIAKMPEVKQSNSNFRVRRTERLQSMDTPVDRILFLQRTVGNQAVSRLMRSGALQAKLRIGQPGDMYEQEADRMADAVMRMPEPGVQRQVEPEEEEEEEMLQAKSREDATSEVPNDLESQINAIKGGGRPLAESERAYFEPRFGRDFSGMRVHSDLKANHLARSINAKAFTIGQDVVFGSGQYSPGSRMGRSLLAHEMTHVVQQSSAKTKGNSSSVIRREQASTPTSIPTYITDIFVDLSTQAVSWRYSDGTRSASHLTSTGAGICRNDRSECYSGNTPGTACTPVDGGPFPVTGNRSPHRYRHFIDFGRPSIGFHHYPDVDGCPWSHGCVRLRQDAIDLLHNGVVTVEQARTRPGVTSTQVTVSGRPNIVRCWTTANGGSCYIRNPTGRGQTGQRCAENDCVEPHLSIFSVEPRYRRLLSILSVESLRRESRRLEAWLNILRVGTLAWTDVIERQQAVLDEFDVRGESLWEPTAEAERE